MSDEKYTAAIEAAKEHYLDPFASRPALYAQLELWNLRWIDSAWLPVHRPLVVSHVTQLHRLELRELIAWEYGDYSAADTLRMIVQRQER